MRLIPYDSFQIETSLPLEKAVERLSSKVDQHELGWLLKSSYQDFEYRGKVNSKEFKIRRNTRFERGSFLPLITGSFFRSEAGTLIHVEMGPRPVDLLFMVFWFGGVGIAFLTGVSSLLWWGSADSFLPFVLIPMLMLIGGAFGTSFSFRNEANRQKVRVEGIFKGKTLESI